MPLKLVDDIAIPTKITSLDHINFIQDQGTNYFLLSDSSGNLQIQVPYIPEFVSNWDADKYECFLFENSYLTAENDIFELQESTLDGRLGWIFPISALDSNENDFVNNKSFKHYRYVAYHKLLNSNYNLLYQSEKLEYRISDIFRGLCVSIISKDEISKLPNFRIEDYALSFLKNDYLIFNKILRGKKAFDKSEQIGILRSQRHSFKVKKAVFDITSNQYTKSLFLDHLYQTENALIKYILLYQILEHFIQELGDSILDSLIEDYKRKLFTKNGLRERLGKLQGDRSLLKKVFEKTAIKRDVRTLFIEKCSFLFADLKLEIGKGFEDVLYDLRNLLTHNYRIVSNKDTQLNEIIYLFELVIFELLISFNEKEEELKIPLQEIIEHSVDLRLDFFDRARVTWIRIKKILRL